MTRTITILLLMLTAGCSKDSYTEERNKALKDAYERVSVYTTNDAVSIYNSKEMPVELWRFYLETDSGLTYGMDYDKIIVPGVSSVTFDKSKFKNAGSGVLLDGQKIVRAEGLLNLTGLNYSIPGTHLILTWNY